MTFLDESRSSGRGHDDGAGIPRGSTQTVTRTRLLERLDRLAPVSIVRALTGAGKTTLVAQWARVRQSDGDAVIWVDGSRYPTSPEAFGSRLLAELASKCPASTVAGVLPDLGEATDWVRDVPDLIAMISRRVIVVIDDAHRAIDPVIVTALCGLALRSAMFHLVLSTRVYHPLKELARGHGLDVTALTGRDLTISAEELPAFAQTWGHRITIERARQVHDAVGGWLTAAQQVLDDTPPQAEELSTVGARSFLREVVLPQITDQDGLLLAMSLALAEQVEIDLVRAVFVDHPYRSGLLGGLSPEGLLTNFERHGVLEPAPADGDTLAWRFPTLVRRVLADTFTREHPEEAAHVHRVIAQWLAGSAPTGERMGQLLTHARAGGDWSLLERIWSDQHLGLTLECPHDVIEAFQHLPRAVVTEYPVLALAEAVVVCLQHPDVGADQLSVLRSFVDASWRSLDDGSLFATRDTHLLGVTAAIVARRSDGHPQAALRLADTVGSALRDDALAERYSVTPANLAWFELQWAITALMANQVSDALVLLARAFNSGRTAGADFIASYAASLSALTHAMTGFGTEASTWVQTHRGFDTHGQWLHRMVTAPAHLAEAILALDRLDRRTAESLLGEVGDGAESTEIWPHVAWMATQHALIFGEPVAMLNHLAYLVTAHPDTSRRGAAPRLLQRCTADLMLALGELNRAQRLLSDAGTEELILAVPRARLAFIAGDFGIARSVASTRTWDLNTVPRDRSELLMIKAAAALAMGDEDAAAKMFSRAHTLADQVGTLIPYLGIPTVTRERLIQLSGTRLTDAQTARLNAAHDIYPDAGELIELSPREEVVLYTMVEHETLADIAKALTVSIHTVKKQTISIYAKLGVHDRAAALLHAHRLGLLPAPKGHR